MFSIPCILGDIIMDEVLMYSSLSVNVISLHIVKRLEIKSLKHTPHALVFLDASTKNPLDTLEDFPLRVKDRITTTDFILIEMAKDFIHHLILGRPFLSTTKVI